MTSEAADKKTLPRGALIGAGTLVVASLLMVLWPGKTTAQFSGGKL